MKTLAVRFGAAAALTALSFAGLAVPAQAALTIDPCGPVVDSVKFCTAENGAGYALVVDSAAAGPRPGISGTLQVGSILTVADGTWDPADATLTHQWLRNDVPVLGATGPTYRLTEADLGKGIRVKSTATGPGYAETTVQSIKTAPVTKAGAAVPSIQASGVSFQLVGEGTSLDDPSRLVIAMPGSFSGAPVIYFQYQWLRDGVPIPGATAKMFDTTRWGAIGALSVRITGHAPGFTPTTRTSLPRGVSEFNTTPGTAVTGNIGLGDVLTAVDEVPWQGFTGPGEPIGHTYTWLRDGVLIPGATGLTRTITAEDQGHTLVVETHSTRRWSYGTSYSNAVAVPAAGGEALKPLANLTRPVLTGAFQVGTSMTVSHGMWSVPADKLKFAYAWMLQDGRMWDGGPSYTPGRPQFGQVVSVFVTVSAPGYAPTRIKVTAPKPLTPRDPVQTKAPAVSGTAAVTKTLTVSAGVWTRYDMRLVKESRQWLRDGKPISGATAPDYTLVGADYGKKISVKVTSTLEGRVLTTQTVNAPAKVAAAALVAATPTVAGTLKPGNVLTVKRGTWTWGTAFTYRWLRNGVPISGATDSTYKVRTADKGTKISIRVTGSRFGYTTVTKTSSSYTVR